uniref:TAFA chemokine like family member 5 n=1 Tax=Anas platyrhynchos platyrhynchos TaxID=8840 RepID=A0A493TXF9_ANAPP
SWWRPHFLGPAWIYFCFLTPGCCLLAALSRVCAAPQPPPGSFSLGSVSWLCQTLPTEALAEPSSDRGGSRHSAPRQALEPAQPSCSQGQLRPSLRPLLEALVLLPGLIQDGRVRAVIGTEWHFSELKGEQWVSGVSCGAARGQLAAGTCEIVTLDRDSSQPRRTIARQTARCACKKGQIAGTTRARPACVDARIIKTKQWCEMLPCLEGEGCDLLINKSGWTCTQPGGRIKTTTPV